MTDEQRAELARDLNGTICLDGDERLVVMTVAERWIDRYVRRCAEICEETRQLPRRERRFLCDPSDTNSLTWCCYQEAARQIRLAFGLTEE